MIAMGGSVTGNKFRAKLSGSADAPWLVPPPTTRYGSRAGHNLKHVRFPPSPQSCPAGSPTLAGWRTKALECRDCVVVIVTHGTYLFG